MAQPVERRIGELISPAIETMGYGLVRVYFKDSGQRTLQIMVERNDNAPMEVQDCANISHTVSAILDVEDPISGAYSLEISSPGIDRPLVKQADFERYAGHEAKIETVIAIEGRRRFKGIIRSVSDDAVLLELDAKHDAQIALDNIASAKLSLTDALIKAHMDAQPQQTDKE